MSSGLEIKRMIVGALRTNCYLLSDRLGNAAVIDPGADFKNIYQEIKNKGYFVKAVILTHGHWDHTGAALDLKEALDCEIIGGSKEIKMFMEPLLSNPFMMGHNAFSFKPDVLVNGGDKLSIGEFSLEVIETPGHTKGSVSYLVDNFLFTGDTLFKGSIGRTDIGGSEQEMRKSLRLLSSLPAETIVYPGHEDSTTIGYELQNNPFLLDIECE